MRRWPIPKKLCKVFYVHTVFKKVKEWRNKGCSGSEYSSWLLLRKLWLTRYLYLSRFQKARGILRKEKYVKKLTLYLYVATCKKNMLKITPPPTHFFSPWKLILLPINLFQISELNVVKKLEYTSSLKLQLKGVKGVICVVIPSGLTILWFQRKCCDFCEKL